MTQNVSQIKSFFSSTSTLERPIPNPYPIKYPLPLEVQCWPDCRLHLHDQVSLSLIDSDVFASCSFSGICIYVKKSCEPGPFLKQAKVATLPTVIGPAGPNIVLRQLVEQIVLSAHSSKQVLKLLASETDKMTIASILKVRFLF